MSSVFLKTLGLKMSFHFSNNETLVPEWAILGGNNICVIPPDLGSLRDQYIVQITGGRPVEMEETRDEIINI